MSTKPKATLHNGAHTAGIFSDLSVDGPIIGTLVLVVDRAKNLPNRKTIGKQDPYCAARLGKEAKKTNTDIRGGQTPKWDQELRFSVHDSPDYYQLKISVFSDDKKTELIGDSWVDLRDIIISGGGQNDQWQPLQCRGKYAGEIRIEITYYDSRPKPKPIAPTAAVSAPIAASTNTGSLRSRPSADLSGPNTMGPRAPISNKRRPLPSDPVTGQAPVQTQPDEAPAPAPAPTSAPAPATVSAITAALPPPAASAPTSVFSQQQQVPQHSQTPPRQQLNTSVIYTPTQSPLSSANYQSSNASPQPALRPQQPPVQVAPAVQYQDYHEQRVYMAGPDGGYEGAPPLAQQYQYNQHQNHHSHHGQHVQQSYSHYRSQNGSRDLTSDAHEYQKQPSHRQQQHRHHQNSHGYHLDYHFDGPLAPSVPSNMGFSEDETYSQQADDRPPLPPIHRNRNNSSGAPSPDAAFRSSLGAKDNKPAMRREVLRSEAHRHSLSSAYPGRPTYQPMDLASDPSALALDQTYQPPNHRHLSHSSSFEGQYNSNYGNVETSSALVASSFRKSANGLVMSNVAQEQHVRQPNQNYFTQASENQLRRQSDVGKHVRRSPSPIASDYRRSPSPLPGQPASALFNTHDSYVAFNRQSSYSELDNISHGENSEAYGLSNVPTSLVPGVDPSLALELRSRIHSEDRQTEQSLPSQRRRQHRYTMPAVSMMETSPSATAPRAYDMSIDAAKASFDHSQNDPLPSQNKTPQRPSFSQSYNTPPQQMPQPPPSKYDRNQGPFSSGISSPGVYDPIRETSPQPHHTIKRKSVSPAPAPVAAHDSERRMSGVPFGPDSYDVLNLALAEAKGAVRPNYNEANGKIISFDGREIDPSDHLPVESWAPLPEPETSRRQSATASPIDHATPTSGRKQLRIAGLPQSSIGSSGVTFSSADDSGTTYSPTARNRLQKRINQQSVAPIPVSNGAIPSVLPQGSTPLAPLNYARQQQQQDNFTPPRAIVRASTYDYPTENHAPMVYGSSPGRMSYEGPAPPVPAKIGAGDGTYGDMPHVESYRGTSSYPDSGAGALATDGDHSLVRSSALMLTGSSARSLPWDNSGVGAGHQQSTGDMALIEEMSRIDLGTGRGRRHNGRYYG
ncbi:hypothetical protein SEPCBS57363_005435 [Sporothrix epigloea]|uniref:C2 domain-containing protein n=1 Tax=Sporothrix epigloea TaxID=1892477 RepID=A0ABP0DXS0_9PEZI